MLEEVTAFIKPSYKVELFSYNAQTLECFERNCHQLNDFVFVLSPVHGGRSRLHLIDLGSCEGYTGSKKDGGASSMSLSGLGNVIISLINGAKHVPHRFVQPISFKLIDLIRSIC